MYCNKEVKLFDDKTIVEIGKRIQQKRVEKGIKAIDFAEVIGIGNNQLSRIENGKAVCRVEHLFVIAQYLDVPVDYLLYGNICKSNQRELLDTLSELDEGFLEKIKKIILILTGQTMS